MEKNKKPLLAAAVIAILVFLVWWVFGRTPAKNNPDPGRQSDLVLNGEAPTTGESFTADEEKILLNFKDKQVIIKGYPMIAKDYVKIFHFVYLGAGGDEDAFAAQEVAVDQQGSYSYRSSNTQNRIFTGVGKDAAGQPIKQTMEIVPQDNWVEISRDCQTSDMDINGLATKTVDCPGFTATACWIPVDGQSTILYKQESAEKITDADMCENLRKNGVRSITFQAY